MNVGVFGKQGVVHRMWGAAEDDTKTGYYSPHLDDDTEAQRGYTVF